MKDHINTISTTTEAHNYYEQGYKQGRADAIEEHFRKIMSFINTNNRGNCDYFIVDQIENYIAEQLKEQKEPTPRDNSYDGWCGY